MCTQACPPWETVRSCRGRAVLFFVVSSVLTQHSKYLINIGSALHTYCEAERLLSLNGGRRTQLRDGRQQVCYAGGHDKPAGTARHPGQDADGAAGLPVWSTFLGVCSSLLVFSLQAARESLLEASPFVLFRWMPFLSLVSFLLALLDLSVDAFCFSFRLRSFVTLFLLLPCPIAHPFIFPRRHLQLEDAQFCAFLLHVWLGFKVEKGVVLVGRGGEVTRIIHSPLVVSS